MKTIRISSLIAGLVILASCSANYKYLSKAEDYHLNPRGSYVLLSASTRDSLGNALSSARYSGELICVDSTGLYLLSRVAEEGEVYKVKFSDINKYSVKYAREKNIAWTIPVYSLLTLSHGWFLILTFPVNLITTTALTKRAYDDYKFKQTDIPLSKLYKFARFPQGLPEGVDLQSIK